MRTSDPVVINAAKQAVKAIQERSNSLFPYELIEILEAKSKVGRHMLLLHFSAYMRIE